MTLITLYATSEVNPNIVPFSYDGNHFTIESATASLENLGLTVIYSTTKEID
jgi:hypothetical protein